MKRIRREKRTVAFMIQLYCRHHHHNQLADQSLCTDCQSLLEYAHIRLDRCTFQNDKPTCARCSVHCYKPEMRTLIQHVMRYSGPRMLFKHPVLALNHVIDQLKKVD